MAIFVVAIGFIFWLVIAGLAGALVAIPPAAASGCDSQASEGSVYAVYITCLPESEFELIVVLPKGPCTVPPPGRCDAPETVEGPELKEERKEFKPDTQIVETPDRTTRTVILGVDCTEPFMVGLPDDVLTECETPTEGELP